MPRLTRDRAGERGSVIVLMVVAVVVLVGMAALVIDVGAALDEKRQLQNGADAAALAVAQRCALSPCDTNAPPAVAVQALARSFSDSNAKDGKSAVSVVYPVPGVSKVQVVASTDGSSGAILPYSFGQVVTGKKGLTLHATATASWGGAQQAAAVPLAITSCDLNAFRALPPDSNLLFAKSPSCGSTDAPGAFGWLDGTCQTTGAESTWVLPTFTVGAQATGDPGKSGPKDCLDGLLNKDVVLPVFDHATGNGNNTRYNLIGFAAIRLTGWSFPGDSAGSGLCSNPASCIKGTLINFVIAGPPGVGIGFGVSSVGLVS